MRKRFMVMAAIIAILSSCGKNPEPVLPDTGTNGPDGPQIHLTLGTEWGTRAFFANTTTAEMWENEIKSLMVYVFDPSGNFVLRYSATAAEIRTRSARFSMPSSSIPGLLYSFWVVVNADYGYVANSSAMNRLMEYAALEEYNSTFAEVDQGCKRPEGFVMTGMGTNSVPSGNAIHHTIVTVRRLVAKVAVRITPDASFGSRHGGGTITIDTVKLSKASAMAYSFYQPGVYPSRVWQYETSQATQKSGDYCDALFYIYENGSLSAGNRVALTLTGRFDADGNAETTDDRTDVEYRFELTGTGGGAFSRNGYYRVNVTIRGLSGNAVMANLTVAELVEV